MVLAILCGVFAAVLLLVVRDDVDPVVVLIGTAFFAAGLIYDRLGEIVKAIKELKDK